MTTNARLRALVELADTARSAAPRTARGDRVVRVRVRQRARRGGGTPLVEPDGRGVRLTAAGGRYAEYARARSSACTPRPSPPPAGGRSRARRVRLAAVTTAGELLLPDLLASFRAPHPGVVLGSRSRPGP